MHFNIHDYQPPSLINTKETPLKNMWQAHTNGDTLC